MEQLDDLRERRALAERLRQAPAQTPSVAVGFDGFVDEMIRVVGQRIDAGQFSAVADITTFAAMIAQAAGRSSLREIVITDTVCGGCAINLGEGLAALGVPVDAFATLGAPPHPAFAEVTQRFRSVESWGSQPGRTLAFEFTDGKVMFSAVSQLAELTAERAADLVAGGNFRRACDEARLIALTDWTLFPHMTAVWRVLQTEVFAQLTHRPSFFIDLVDPTGRSPAHLREALSVLSDLEAHGPVTLGLNGTEANAVARALELPTLAAENGHDLGEQAGRVREALRVSEVVIHGIKFAAAATAGEVAVASGPYCASPLKTTGAGDRFNAGYALGSLLNLEMPARVLLGVAGSGHYVRRGRSASRADLIEFLAGHDWSDPQLNPRCDQRGHGGS
jgi:sugar/nucleoside kinase (ribokinase family)